MRAKAPKNKTIPGFIRYVLGVMACVGTTSFTSCSFNRLSTWKVAFWLNPLWHMIHNDRCFKIREHRNYCSYEHNYITLCEYSLNGETHVMFFHDAWGVIEPVCIFDFIVGELCVCGGVQGRILFNTFLHIFSKAQAVRIKLHKVFLEWLICSECPPNMT